MVHAHDGKTNMNTSRPEQEIKAAHTRITRRLGAMQGLESVEMTNESDGSEFISFQHRFEGNLLPKISLTVRKGQGDAAAIYFICVSMHNSALPDFTVPTVLATPDPRLLVYAVNSAVSWQKWLLERSPSLLHHHR